MVEIVGITPWTWDSISHSRKFKPAEYSVVYFQMIVDRMKNKTEEERM